jgi:hypothetical protein
VKTGACVRIEFSEWHNSFIKDHITGDVDMTTRDI